MRITIYIIFLILINHKAIAQTISKSDYSMEFIHEDFNSNQSLYFEDQSNEENYIKINNTNLFLIRKNKVSPYLIFAKHNALDNFILKTKLRIGPTENKKSSIGVILKVQKNGDGGIIFEINKKGEYRIYSTQYLQPQALSGQNKKWKKSKLVNGVDELNAIEIRSENNNYDIYVNHKFLLSIGNQDIVTNDTGINGIFINSDTKAKVSYFYINTKENKKLEKSSNTIINQLNERIENLEEENTHLKKTIKIFSKEDSKLRKNNASNTNQKVTQIEEQTELLDTNTTNTKKQKDDLLKKIKELSIQKDFETNGINPSDMIKRTSKVSTLKVEKIYSVQIGVFMKKQEKKSFNDFWCEMTKLGTYVYYSGKFRSPNEAASHLKNLMLKGYTNAFIITLNK